LGEENISSFLKSEVASGSSADNDRKQQTVNNKDYV